MPTARRAAEAPYTVDQHDSIETAMALIEQNNHRSVIVLDQQGVAVGTLSDGDIRKALLDRRLLSTPVHQVMNTHFIALREDDADRAQAIFAQAHIFLIPLVDEAGRLLKVLKAY